MRAYSVLTQQEFFISKNSRNKRGNIDELLQEFDCVMLKLLGWSKRYKKAQFKYVVLSKETVTIHWEIFYKRTGENEIMKGVKLAAKTNVYINQETQPWLYTDYNPTIVDVVDFWNIGKPYTPWKIQTHFWLHAAQPVIVPRVEA